MSKRTCQECGKRNNDPGRMVVCFQCWPPRIMDIEQKEPADDGSKDCEGLYNNCEDCPRNYSCVADFNPPCVKTPEPYKCNDPNCALCFPKVEAEEKCEAWDCEGCNKDHSLCKDCTDKDCTDKDCIDPITPPTGFTRDFRTSNPNLHFFYVKQAIKHLAMVRKMINKLFGESNGNTYGFAMALVNERDRLVKEDADYADAQEILDSIGLK